MISTQVFEEKERKNLGWFLQEWIEEGKMRGISSHEFKKKPSSYTWMRSAKIPLYYRLSSTYLEKVKQIPIFLW